MAAAGSIRYVKEARKKLMSAHQSEEGLREGGKEPTEIRSLTFPLSSRSAEGGIKMDVVMVLHALAFNTVQCTFLPLKICSLSFRLLYVSRIHTESGPESALSEPERPISLQRLGIHLWEGQFLILRDHYTYFWSRKLKVNIE